MTYNTRSHILGQLRACGLVKTSGIGDLKDLNNNSHNCALVRAIITGALYPKVGCFTRPNLVVLKYAFVVIHLSEKKHLSVEWDNLTFEIIFVVAGVETSLQFLPRLLRS